jgi:hypothetical protein
MSVAPIKRTHCYIQQPWIYSIAGCLVDESHKITWSEYEGLLWCFDCGFYFVPMHWGIFDGPIPVGVSGLLGISFDRINLATNEVVKFDLKGDGSGTSDEYRSTWN